MTDQREQLIKDQLLSLTFPFLASTPITSKSIKTIAVDQDSATVTIVLGFPFKGFEDEIQRHIVQSLKTLTDYTHITVNLSSKIENHRVQHGLKGIQQIKNIIAIGSGKGGVGKSTVTANLAMATAQLGAKVGILDADIYGPSQPEMFGSYDEPEVLPGKKLKPVERFGIQTMSIGYLVDTKTPMVWRGPMVSGALQQMLNDTLWQDLDYLFIDLPPGTGDIQLTMSQKVPVSGAVIVTTPQDLALLDARRAIEMFNKVKVPILGVVENMSVFTCPNCGESTHLFGEHGGEKIADETGAPLLGQLPLNIELRTAVDKGRPFVAAEPIHAISEQFRHTALELTAHLAKEAKDYAKAFPNIVVDNQ